MGAQSSAPAVQSGSVIAVDLHVVIGQVAAPAGAGGIAFAHGDIDLHIVLGEDLLGKSKKADIVKARQICAYLLCEMLSLPLDFIGKTLGGRDHTTIMYARDKMEKLEKLNDKVAKEIDDIKNIILKK